MALPTSILVRSIGVGGVSQGKVVSFVVYLCGQMLGEQVFVLFCFLRVQWTILPPAPRLSLGHFQ